MIDVEKFYRIAKGWVGELNRDLVHHVYEKTYGKLPADNPEGYFYRAMKNELRSDSRFYRQYSRIERLELGHDEDEIDLKHERVQSILKQLEHEGYRLEVKVFLELAKDASARELNKITGVRLENLIRIRNFVKDEVTKRYEYID